jgi:hypothetical protein
MPSPIITFRLSTNQIARGLQAIRSFDPTYKLTNLNQLVKFIYNDYINDLKEKIFDQDNLVDPTILEEVEIFINSPMKSALNLIDLIEQEYLTKEEYQSCLPK